MGRCGQAVPAPQARTGVLSHVARPQDRRPQGWAPGPGVLRTPICSAWAPAAPLLPTPRRGRGLRLLRSPPLRGAELPRRGPGPGLPACPRGQLRGEAQGGAWSPRTPPPQAPPPVPQAQRPLCGLPSCTARALGQRGRPADSLFVVALPACLEPLDSRLLLSKAAPTLQCVLKGDFLGLSHSGWLLPAPATTRSPAQLFWTWG